MRTAIGVVRVDEVDEQRPLFVDRQTVIDLDGAAARE
jgi:hypothetical protein